MILHEQNLDAEIKDIGLIKREVSKQFDTLREDRNAVLKKVDNMDYEIG